MRWMWMWIAAVLAVAAGAQDDELVVSKERGQSNPTLSVQSFNGDSAVLQYLKDCIRVSDWFDLVDKDGEYQLQGVNQAGANSLELRLFKGTKPVTAFRRESAGGDSRFVVRHAVDELIRKAFNKPGLAICTARLAMVKEINGVKEIYLAEFDGSNPEILTRNGTLSVEPAWGPGGKQLFYTMYSNHHTDVVMIDFAANSQRRIAAFPGLNATPSPSPDGRRVALTLSKDGNPDIYLLDPSNRATTRLTKTEAVESSPAWSPDGSQLAYVSDGGGLRPSLYIMPAGGGKPRHLIRGSECVSPDWSPVSKLICFSIRLGAEYHVAFIDPADENAEPTIVSRGAGDWEAPSWAPDGRHIVCSRFLGGKRSLVLLDSWYFKATPLKKYTGNDTLPAYSHP